MMMEQLAIRLFGRWSIIGRSRYFFLDRHYNRTVQVFLVLMCLGATLASTVLFRDVDAGGSIIKGLIPILAVAGIAGFTIIYSNVQNIAMFTVVISLFLGDGVGTGTGTKITFTLLLLCAHVGIWLFKMLLIDRHIQVRAAPANLPSLVFMAVVVISYLWSNYYVTDTVQWIFEDKLLPRTMTAVVLIISPAAYFLYANHVRSLNTMRFFIWLFLIAGTLFAGLHLSGVGVFLPLNARGQFPTWVGVFAMSQLLFNDRLKWWMRVWMVGLAVAWFYITIGLGLSWLSGWVPLTFAIIVLLFIYSRRLFVAAVFVALVIVMFNLATVTATFNEESSVSGGTRMEAWGNALDLTADHYLFGTGPAGYALYFTTYLSGFFQLSHNNYVDIIAQTGIVGFIVWLWLWGCITVMAVRNYRAAPRVGFQHALAAALLAANLSSLVTMMLGDWVTPFTYTQGLGGIDYTIWSWMLAGMTVSQYYLNTEPQPSAETELVPALPEKAPT